MKPNQTPNLKAWRIKGIGRDEVSPWNGPWWGETIEAGIQSYLYAMYNDAGSREVTVTKVQPQYSWETSPWQDIATYRVYFTLHLKNINVKNHGDIYLKAFPYEA